MTFHYCTPICMIYNFWVRVRCLASGIKRGIVKSKLAESQALNTKVISLGLAMVSEYNLLTRISAKDAICDSCQISHDKLSVCST